jgi:hypothetical protein
MNAEHTTPVATLQDLRRRALFDPTTGICTPRNPALNCQNDVFDRCGPAMRATAAPIVRRELTPRGHGVLAKAKFAEAVDLNPFAPSFFRSHGLQAWDAAVQIPRPAFTVGGTVAIRDVHPVRSVNAYWKDEAQRALQKVGPLGPHQLLHRPRGPFITDFLEDEHWLMIEAAHVLAHHRGDHADLALDPIDPVQLPTARLFQQAIGELMIASRFNLPINIGEPLDPYPMRPHLPYGLTVCPTTYTTSPILAVPMDGSFPLIPDETLAIVDVAIQVSGPPLGRYHGELLQPDPKLARGCQPTLAEIVGFEVIDVITHHEVAAPYPDARSPRLHWGVHHLDLMSPALLAEYIQIGQAAGVKHPEGGAWRRIPDWFHSEEFEAMWLATPPPPCPFCMMWTPVAKEHLKRPRFLPWVKSGYRERDDWRSYLQKARELRDCVDKSREMAEPDGRRKERRAGHKAKLEKLKQGKWLAEANEKWQQGYPPKGRHLRAVQAHQAELQRQQAVSVKPAA